MVGGYSKVASYDKVGEQLHYSNPGSTGTQTVVCAYKKYKRGNKIINDSCGKIVVVVTTKKRTIKW